MKRSLYLFVLTLFTIGLAMSCREEKTAGEKIEDGIEKVGDGIEDGAEEVEDAVEDAADDN
ncbi:hypothetical protein BFP77_11075 [Maribacter sp. 4U21]|uniref:hypothetical protein n=1 Tax=Maribacter sp. 4U21 TaxID=1889779 RepID=UPI000C1492D0|nr:hypothetical protein [Maribacter sp. 4U21]PIB27951.1 hypothetical protein BFP77_11075 [Maribacter sp. 4U21]